MQKATYLHIYAIYEFTFPNFISDFITSHFLMYDLKRSLESTSNGVFISITVSTAQFLTSRRQQSTKPRLVVEQTRRHIRFLDAEVNVPE